jgi:hypothetical protein
VRELAVTVGIDKAVETRMFDPSFRKSFELVIPCEHVNIDTGSVEPLQRPDPTLGAQASNPPGNSRPLRRINGFLSAAEPFANHHFAVVKTTIVDAATLGVRERHVRS